MPRLRAKKLKVPSGNTPSFALLPARMPQTRLTVPSPPAATTISCPCATASSTAPFMSPGSRIRRARSVRSRMSASIRRASSPVRVRPEARFIRTIPRGRVLPCRSPALADEPSGGVLPTGSVTSVPGSCPFPHGTPAFSFRSDPGICGPRLVPRRGAHGGRKTALANIAGRRHEACAAPSARTLRRQWRRNELPPSSPARHQRVDLVAQGHRRGGSRPGHRDRRRRGGEIQRLDRVGPAGEGCGEGAVEGVAGAGRVHRRARRHRRDMHRPCPVAVKRTVLSQRDHGRPGAPGDQRIRGPSGLVEARHGDAGEPLRLALVRRDDVAEPEHAVGQRRRRGGVENGQHPRLAGDPESAQRRVERLFKLGEKHLCPGDRTGPRLHICGRDRAGDARADDDRVRAGGVLDEDVGRAGVAVGIDAHLRRHSGVGPDAPGEVGEGVGPEFRHEPHPCPGPRGGHRLVRALATRPQHEGLAEQCLAHPRRPFGAESAVGHEHPQNRDLAGHAVPSRAIFDVVPPPITSSPSRHTLEERPTGANRSSVRASASRPGADVLAGFPAPPGHRAAPPALPTRPGASADARKPPRKVAPSCSPTVPVPNEPPHWNPARHPLSFPGPSFRRRPALRPALAAVLALLSAPAALAESHNLVTSHGISAFGELKYPPDFQHFDYVNPEAPKGGFISFRGALASQTFDSLNLFILDGDPAQGLERIYDTLLARAWDEPDAAYGLLAESLEYPEDRGHVVFNLRPEARFSDGKPVTADDVVFTFEILKSEGSPLYRLQLKDIESATALAADRVRIDFADGVSARDLIQTAGAIPILPEHYYETVDFTRSTLEPPLGSGPYVVESADAGRSVRYCRNEDYWAADLPVNVGAWNFDCATYEYFADNTAAFEALKSGGYLFHEEFFSALWATAYDFPALDEGWVIRDTIPDGRAAGAQGFWLNMRRPQFADPLVREALSFVFNFEWSNETLFYGLYGRTDSFWEGTPMEATGRPTGAELALLEPHRDALPESVFTEPAVSPPVSGAQNADRRLIAAAGALLDEAGWEVATDGTRRNADGRKLTVEFLDDGPAFERIVLPYVEKLGRLGIEATFTLVDAAQMQQRH